MAHAFPYWFEPDAGRVLVQFIDVPEAHTFGATDAEAGGDNALDCLIAALGGYIRLGRKIRSRARRGADPSSFCRPSSRPSSRCMRRCARNASPVPSSPAASACRRMPCVGCSISITAPTSIRWTGLSPRSASASRCASSSRCDVGPHPRSAASRCPTAALTSVWRPET